MSDKQPSPTPTGGLAGRFNNFSSIGASLRQSAQELQAKAAAQVNELAERAKSKEVDVDVPTPSKAESVEKSELLEILQKMNKKVKALTVIRQQLTTKVESLETDKARLKSLVTDEILNGMVDVKEDQDEVLQLQAAWRQVDEQNALNLQHLQNEFLNFRQQSQQGDAWEAEKKELLETHEKEMLALKESLTQSHKAEMEKLTEAQAQSSSTADEVEKVKQAAKAQLLAFKNKVQVARTAELEKLRGEMAEAAKNELEQRVKEHQAEMEALKAELAIQTAKHQDKEASESATIEELQKQHAEQIEAIKNESTALLVSEIEKTRQSVEEAIRNEMETKWQQVMEQAQKKHDDQLEQVKSDAAKELSQLQSHAESLKVNAESTSITAENLQVQLANEKESHKSALESLQNELEDRERSLQEMRENIQALTEQIAKTAATETDIVKLKDVYEGEFESLRTKLLAEKESALKESQDKLMQAKRQAEEKVQAVMDATKTEYEAKLLDQQKMAQEELIHAIDVQAQEHQARLEHELKQAETRTKSELESIRIAHLKDLESVTRANDEMKSKLRALSEREKELMVKLEEADSRIQASQSGAEESSKSLDEALSKQRASYEEIVNEQRKRLADLEEEIKMLSESSQSIAGDKASLEAELEQIRSELAKSIELNNQAAAEFERRLSDQAAALEADQSEKTKVLLQAAREEVGSARDAEIESLKGQYELQLEESKKKEEAVAQSFAKVKAAYAQKLQSTETEFNGRINSLENEKSSLTEKLESLEKQISTSSWESHDAIQSLKSKYEAKLSASEAAKSEALQTAEERIIKLEKSLGEAETVIAEMKAQLKESESNTTQEVEKVRSQCTAQFEAMLREKSDALADLSRKLEAATTAEAEATQQVEKLSETLQKTQFELKQSLETTSDGANQQLEDLEKKLKEGHDLYVETLKADHEKALRDIDEERQKDRDTINQLAAATLEKEKGLLSEELGLKIRQLSEEKEELRSAMEKHVDQLTSQFKAKLDDLRKTHSSETLQFQDTIKEKEIKCTEAVDQLKKLTAGTALLRSEHEKLKKQLSVALESTKVLSTDLEKARKEKEDTMASASKKESSMIEIQESLTREKNAFLEKIQNLEREVKSKANMTEELQGKVSALSDNLNSIVEERNNLAEKLARAEKQESKLKSSESEVSELREQVNMLKLESTKNRNLVERLQSEKEASERSHGQRTALVGLLEKQLADATDNNSELNAKLEAIKYDMSQREETIQQYLENIRNLSLQLEEAESKSKVAAEALAAVPKGPDAKTKNMVESLQKELQIVRQQMAKKSTAAQKLIQEKEQECVELRKANSALQQEVDQGSLSDRRILELAAKQSNRESQQLAQITARDKTIESMMEKVVERDNQLAFMENKVHEVEQQIEELRRVRRREDVNLDYLKTTVVKYLSLPPGSSERAGLLPVLATLLQFDQNDYKVIEDGKSKISWWGSIAPTLISAPESVPIPRPLTTSSAEVSVNRQNGEGSSRGTTSLQF
ncbi:hypothetical protein FisN_11Lh142 [Fistulifera solaris]|uniref:GRIP domain-containing protein n=1 Tax=Fistulifera solaris TaxID=1519565 RepID=A0A1Z5J7A5_FISSO|nr:hypothetical protein FisN_11Lh142 [Fistulifera solaris]|eukprot:GAX09877.1 hypothetical protein FisN_11Lh142 [Fistulifera solaris]